MENFKYRTKGVCASEIRFDLEGHTVHNVSFVGGCNGNLRAISKLVEGMEAEKVVDILKGNTCGFKKTSCADQFAIALSEALGQQ